MPQKKSFAKGSKDIRRFRLVSRSQNDGRADDPDAPPLVLEPCFRANDARRSGLTEEELLQAPDSLLAKHPEAFADPDAPLRTDACNDGDEDEDEADWEEQLDGDCYFPKDGYNYEQHLKRVSGTGNSKESSGSSGGVVGVVLEAPQKVPEKELKVQKPCTNEEAEVMRALEYADEYEELEDGALEDILPGGALDADIQIWGPNAAQDNMPDLAAFKAMHAARLAAGGGLDSLFEDGEEDDDEYDEEGSDEEGDEDGAAAGSRRRRRPRGDGKGVGSSAEAMKNAEDFEEFFAAEYAEDADLGALDDEEVEGPVALENVEGFIDEYIEDQQKEKEQLESLHEPQRQGRLEDEPRVIEETRALIARHYADGKDEDDPDETSSGEEDTDESRTWDCESVLSTLSNLSNRPGRIGKLKIVKKPAPMKPVTEQDENESEDSDEADAVVELPDVITERKKDETAEEKKLRKASVKEMRRICRQMKKESKETYKTEAAKLPCNKPGNGDIRQKSRTFRM